jgi:Fe-S-cluster containining protein
MAEHHRAGEAPAMSPEHPFTRTSCACPACQACCTRQPGPLLPGELEAIAAHLGTTVRDASHKFWASPGGVLGHRATGQTLRVGTITPRLRAGRCVFLDAESRCTIHAVAPFGCAYFDTHMTAEEAHPRGLYMMRAQATSEAYQSLRRTLAPAASHRPTAYDGGPGGPGHGR